MNKKIYVDLEVLKILYLKYRDYFLPAIAIILSWYLFIQIVVPKIQNFLTTKDIVLTDEQTLTVLTQNYNTIAQLDKNEEDKFLTIANKALPPQKDFAGILNAVSAAAVNSSVVVNDYSFPIGDINAINSVGKPNQSIQVTLVIKGDTNHTKAFISSLSKTLPLSEIVSLNVVEETTSTITANFFYVPLSRVNFVDTNSLPTLNQAQKKLLNDLARG